MRRPYAQLPSSFGESSFDAEERSRRANRRRLIVFVLVFAVVSIAGLVYDFSRPAIYEATARLNFVPVSASPAATGRFALRDEVEFLSSRPLLATVYDELKKASTPPSGIGNGDPTLALQSMLTVAQVPGTNVVTLQARGGQPAFLATFLDHLVHAYQLSLGERYRSASAGTLVDVGDEARKLDAAVVAKRLEADAFRAKYNIVSLERDENQVLSEVRATTAAINAANDKVVAAETRFDALQEAQAAGRSVTRSRDNPTLASLEQQAVAIRAELREVARTFTQEYMQIDPRIRSLRARLAEIEQQIVAQREASQQGALQEAREELSGSRAAVATLRRQLATNQQSVQGFTSRFNEYRAMQEEVTRLEQLRQKAVERRAALAAEENGRTPKVEAVESAAIPTSPASPPYMRDAAIALIAALFAGLAALGIVELFNRPPRQPASVIVQQSWSPGPGAEGAMQALGAAPRREALATSPRSAMAALAAPSSLPRELETDELQALLDTVGPNLRAAFGLLLSGLAPAEVVGLHAGDVDRAGGSVQVETRRVALAPRVLESLPGDRGGDAPLLIARSGAAMTVADLDTGLLYAAHDAGLDAPDEITADALHHTYAAFLVRQGMRFSELAELVGDLRPDALASYRQLAPAGRKQGVADLDRVLPVLRRAAG